MAEKVAQLSANGGQPEVEIIIGQLNRGDHLIILLDQNDANGVIVGQQQNGGPVAVRYSIQKPLSQLAANLLRWNAIIGTNTTSPENASVTLRVIQNGQIVPGGEIVTRKKITVLGLIKDRVRLQLV